MKNIDTITLLALADAIAKEVKSRKETVSVGTHTVAGDLAVSIEGTVSKSEDESYTPTVDIPMKATLALFVRYTGMTGDNALKALERAMSEALNTNEKGSEIIEEIAVLDKAEKKVKETLAALPKKTRSGKTKVAVKVDIVPTSAQATAEAAE